MTSDPKQFDSTLARRHRYGAVFAAVCWVSTWLPLLVLFVLLGAIVFSAWGWLDLRFLTSIGEWEARKAGILAALWGTLWLLVLTALFSVPLGVGAAIYLEEYARANWLTRLIQLNVSNLAGVPSIVFGILGFTVFVRMFGLPKGEYFFVVPLGFTTWEVVLPFGRTVISGALTLTLLSLPVVIIAAQEALRSVPASIRHASLALGATKWQTIRNQVIPAAMPGILTGVILAMSRAIGETAPLVVLGAASYVGFAPGRLNSFSDLVSHPGRVLNAPFDSFTALPLQIYKWVNDPREEYQHVAAAGIVVLLTLLLLMNAVAIFLRQYFQKKIRW